MYIEIDDQKIDYSLIRRRGMKSIRMKINEDGMLVVSAPYGVSKAYIEELIRKNAATLSQGKKQSDEAHKRWEDFVHEKMRDVPDWTIKQYGDDIVAGKPFEAGSIYNGLPIVTTQIAFQNIFWDAYKKFNGYGVSCKGNGIHTILDGFKFIWTDNVYKGYRSAE